MLRDLIRAGQLLKIEVLDHVIMGRANSELANAGGCTLGFLIKQISRSGHFGWHSRIGHGRRIQE